MRALRLIPLCLVLAALPGCFVTRPLGLGPDPGPNEVAPGDTPEMIYEKGERLFEAKEWDDASDVFEELWQEHQQSRLASDAQFYDAEAKYGEGKYEVAFKRYRAYLDEHPLAAHAPLIQRRLYDMGTYMLGEGRGGFLGLVNYAADGIDMLEFLVTAFPNGDLADMSLMYAAEYEAENGDHVSAAEHLQQLLDAYPSSEWALTARLQLARSYRALNRGTAYDADALKRSAAEYAVYVEQVGADPTRAAEYADLLVSARAEFAEVRETLAQKGIEAADFYLKSARPEAAQAELRSVVREYPETPGADEARARLGLSESTGGAE